MSPLTRAALRIAVGVGALEAVLALAGWLERPGLSYLAWLSVPIVVASAALAVRESAGEGRDYAGQLIAGVEVGLLGGFAVVVLTWLIHQVLAPEALAETRALAEARALAAGGGPAAVADAVGLSSAFGRSLLRFIEVLMTSALTGLAVARRPRAAG